MGFHLLRLAPFQISSRRTTSGSLGIDFDDVPKGILAIAKQVIFQIPHESGAFLRMLAHLKSPELLFTSQVLIHVLFGNQFKGHEILPLNVLLLN